MNKIKNYSYLLKTMLISLLNSHNKFLFLLLLSSILLQMSISPPNYSCKTFVDINAASPANEKCQECWKDTDIGLPTWSAASHFTLNKINKINISDPFTLSNDICQMNCAQGYWNGVHQLTISNQDDQECIPIHCKVKGSTNDLCGECWGP